MIETTSQQLNESRCHHFIFVSAVFLGNGVIITKESYKKAHKAIRHYLGEVLGITKQNSQIFFF